VVSSRWHVRSAIVEGGGFVSELGFTLGRGVSGCVGYGAPMNPSLMEMAEDDDYDASDYLFAIFLLTLGS